MKKTRGRKSSETVSFTGHSKANDVKLKMSLFPNRNFSFNIENIVIFNMLEV
jgi:hypothetical protein